MAAFATDDDETGSNVTVETVDDGNGKSHKRYIVRNKLKPTSLQIDKKWFTYNGTPEIRQLTTTDNDTFITVELYRHDAQALADNSEDAGVNIGKFKIYAKRVECSEGNISYSTAGEDAFWSIKFDKLDAYYVDKNGKLKAYSYSVKEADIPGGYIQDFDSVFTVDDETITSTTTSVLQDGVFTKMVIVNKNNESFTLPETGSGKLIPIYIAGALTMLASGALLVYRRKLRNN